MITLIEARNFRCLKHISVPMGKFHVLVGPNASGKSAFLDILPFLRDFINEGLEIAVKKRMDNFLDLVWGRGNNGDSFEMALEVSIPDKPYISILRYETLFKYDTFQNKFLIEKEKTYWKPNSQLPSKADGIVLNSPSFIKISPLDYELRQGKSSGTYQTMEAYAHYSGYKLVLDRDLEPSFLWFKKLFNAIHVLDLQNKTIKKPCEPATGIELKTDGSNLAWVVEDFKKKNPDHFKEWLKHLQTALPYLQDVRAFVRPEDRHCFLMLKYEGGLELPSWIVSDGTLRLLALTLPVYLPNTKGVYLFEEPENGIHPQAIQTVIDSLKSFYDGQVMVTTHSPLVLSLVEPEEIICFSHKPETGTKIITGGKHPVLKEWKRETSLGVLFASGIFDADWDDDEGSDRSDG